MTEPSQVQPLELETRTMTCSGEKCNAQFEGQWSEWTKNLPQHCPDCVKEYEDFLQHRKTMERHDVIQARFKYARSVGDMTPRMYAARFNSSNPETEKDNIAAWTTARTFMNEDVSDASYFVSGPKGVGKTWMMQCILMHKFYQGLDVARVKCAWLVERGMSFKGAPDINRWGEVPWLLIDDIAGPKWEGPLGGSYLEALYRVIDARWENQLHTLVTSNVVLAEEDGTGGLIGMLAKAAGSQQQRHESIIDRLNPCIKRTMAGPSLRPRHEEATEGESES